MLHPDHQEFEKKVKEAFSGKGDSGLSPERPAAHSVVGGVRGCSVGVTGRCSLRAGGKRHQR